MKFIIIKIVFLLYQEFVSSLLNFQKNLLSGTVYKQKFIRS